MQLPRIQTVQCCAAPGEILPWLRRLIDALRNSVPPEQTLILGPSTMSPSAPVLFETVAIYLHTDAPTIPAGDIENRTTAQTDDSVALAMTRLPPRQCPICLEFRHWLPQLMTPDFVLKHLTHYLPTYASTSMSGVIPPSSHPSNRSTAGHAAATRGPRLVCNRWLAEQLAQTSLPHLHRAFYRAWLEQYRALRGDYPVDPRRSFRAAVATIRRHNANQKRGGREA